MSNNEIIAEHPARCPDCLAFIKPGDWIVRPNGFEQWRHASCPKTKFDFEPGDVCGECFTVRATNGKCAYPA